MLNRNEAEKRGLVIVGGYGFERSELRDQVHKIEKMGFKAWIVWRPFKETNIYDEYEDGHELVYAEPAYIYFEELERIEKNLKSCEQRRSSLTKAYALAMVELDKEEDELFEKKEKVQAEQAELKKG